MNTKATARAEQHAFIKPSEWRSMAVDHPKDIDIEDEARLGTVIPWMDGLDAKALVVSEYVIMVRERLWLKFRDGLGFSGCV